MGNRIPEMSDAELSARFKRTKPVVRFTRGVHDDAGKLHWIKPVDLRTVAFTWDPKASKPATGLAKIGEITTYHTYGYYGFFKPSIAEVLAQIPHEFVDRAVAFETHGPETAEDLNRHSVELNEGYHVATTVLYGRSKG